MKQTSAAVLLLLGATQGLKLNKQQHAEAKTMAQTQSVLSCSSAIDRFNAEPSVDT
jgi:hypothetical protein